MWGPKYSSKKFYAHVCSLVEAHSIYKLVWRSCCTPQIKFFAWLGLVDRLNTKDMLRRRHLNVQDDTLCVMWNNGVDEDIEHLFFSCPSAHQCWSTINFNWDASIPLQERFVKEKEIQGLPFSWKLLLLLLGSFGSYETIRFSTTKILRSRFGLQILRTNVVFSRLGSRLTWGYPLFLAWCI